MGLGKTLRSEVILLGFISTVLIGGAAVALYYPYPDKGPESESESVSASTSTTRSAPRYHTIEYSITEIDPYPLDRQNPSLHEDFLDNLALFQEEFRQKAFYCLRGELESIEGSMFSSKQYHVKEFGMFRDPKKSPPTGCNYEDFAGVVRVGPIEGECELLPDDSAVLKNIGDVPYVKVCGAEMRLGNPAARSLDLLVAEKVRGTIYRTAHEWSQEMRRE